MHINIEKLYEPKYRRFMAEMLIEKAGITIKTKSGVKLRFLENPLTGNFDILVSQVGMPPCGMASRFMEQKFPGPEYIPEAVLFAAAPGFYWAIADDRRFEKFENELREQQIRAAQKKAEAERLARVKRLLPEDREASAISNLCALSKSCDTEMAHRYADQTLCEVLQQMGYVDIVNAYRSVYKWYD